MINYSQWPHRFLSTPRRRLSADEEYIIHSNTEDFDIKFRSLPEKCGAPGCGYPLANDNFRLVDFGDVCQLCHDIYTAVADRAYFMTLHRLYKEEQKNKKDKLGLE